MSKDGTLDWAKGDIPDFPEYKEMIERVQSGQGHPAQCEDWQQKIDEWHFDLFLWENCGLGSQSGEALAKIVQTR